MDQQEKIEPILELLDQYYPNARTALNFSNPLELLVATVLSAQCTDVKVNQVTPGLFRRYPTARDYAQASQEELEQAIHATGFFRQKAKNLKEIGRVLMERFDGQVPARMEDLVKLPGIGRKTANVILGNAFGVPGIVVDTHVSRVASRLGLISNKDAVKIEYELMALVPQDRWIKFSHQLIRHGRQLCNAKKPRCAECPLLPYCDFGKKQQPIR
ncbi:MAG: endonuclease III [Deltaproteobacteria bacterium]|nr:endonuclease III [Deltaproteobacteria bacterium]MBW1952410.1 endonuclease III [Deltaproteobacteria bacterium]MBW1986653.1 endonuclease III [Deltaproteobacteria bacterium]MBW2134861.1 endonuclease III [Deltaproteobacteria bacterium]